MQNARPQIMWQIVAVGGYFRNWVFYLQQQAISNKATHYKSFPKFG
jgi:hypothetical protein